MQTIILRSFTLLFLCTLISPVYSQDVREVNATVNITSRVIQSIELITVNNIRITNLQPGQIGANISAVNSGDAGHMIAIGNPNAGVRISFIKNLDLNQVNGTGVIRFEYEVSVNDMDDQASSELIVSDNRPLQFNSEGRLFLWIGGKVDLIDAKPGNYNGEFILEIEYI